MASDLSSIIQSEITNTLESLLSVSASIKNTEKITSEDIDGHQCICVEIDYTFSKFQTVKWKFYIPTPIATKFEFLMLGGIGDLKDTIDDEIADAINEIVSNICGSMSTAFNAQGYDDIGNAKFSIVDNKILQCDTIDSLDNIYNFTISLDSDEFNLFIEFENSFLPFIAQIATGIEGGIVEQDNLAANDALGFTVSPAVSSVLSLLGEDSMENLKLLFDIKLKLSVRLGSKTILLKDILSWDVGTIIELEQMVNEPLDILINGIKIGEGEAVIVEGKFGVKIKFIGEKSIV